ncbi:MAG: RidA family protein [Firmicutes bacterium]|nr:RidA family protein [Bacillota bacterium]
MSKNKITIINTKDAPAAIGPYSQGVVAGDLIFFSGSIPLCPKSGEVVSGSITKQTEQVISNITALLKAAGVGFDNVIKTTCFLTSMNDFAEFNEVYSKYFVSKPARSTVAVSALPKGVDVEIEVVAIGN